MAVFIPRGTLQPYGAPIERSEIIANSGTRTIGDSVKALSGFIAAGSAGALVYGHVTAIATDKGVGLNTTGAAGAAMGSFINAYTVASDNQTVGKVRAVCDVSKYTLYTNSTGGTLGATTGSNLLGYNLDLTDQVTLDETSAVLTSCQYNSIGVDPASSTLIIVHVLESQVFGV